MQGNGAAYENPDDQYDDKLSDDFDLLDDLADDEAHRENARRRAQRRTHRARYEQPGRRPASEREGAFNALMWLLDGATGLIEEMRHNDLGLPEDFWVHAYAARKESLMALRAVLDDWIDEDQPTPPADARQKRQERRGGINIDF
ncbi:MAG: hypothetical protein IAE81_16255 [Caldilineaceae bacterium]|jgi:hypothetical protein|nr:hypothetical protein [Caldilineaceae bacterium]